MGEIELCDLINEQADAEMQRCERPTGTAGYRDKRLMQEWHKEREHGQAKDQG